MLSLPHRLRYQLAWRHDVCREVAAVFMHAVLRALGSAAEHEGVSGGRGGGIAIVQRFGGALNLNIHVHALVLDGVFAPGARAPRFHPVRVTDFDVAGVLATVEARVGRLLTRRGLASDEDDGDAWEGTPLFGGLAAASVQGLQAIGEARGRRVRRLGSDVDVERDVMRASPGSLHARANGFDLHAAVRVPAGQRDRLESVCRYALRPPVAAHRVRLTEEGGVPLELRHRWADGTTHLVFEPVEFLGRLAVLVPLRDQSAVLLRRARRESRMAAPDCAARRSGRSVVRGGWRVRGAAVRPRVSLGGALTQRTFGFDVPAYPRCVGRLRRIALIERRAVIARILAHLGLPAELPEGAAARPPPVNSPGY